MIDYKNELNAAQYEAATTLNGPILVIAGAGSGKTRTVVYRLAHMVEQGISPSRILLLTFTRKAAHEMQMRASRLLSLRAEGADFSPWGARSGLVGVQGGTFHAFAYSVLRQHKPVHWQGTGELSIMDSADSAGTLKHCKDALGIGKGDKSFPKIQTALGLISKSRNKELSMEDVLRREAVHLLPYGSDLCRMGEAYNAFKRQHALLDYDDLLFELEELLQTNDALRENYQEHFQYLMVDEFQDTNLVQARLVRLLGGGYNNVMAVGDDAQSIYAFRGANVQNILQFPQMFPNVKIIKLEENYRSVQPVLDLTNAILDDAPEAFHKRLFTRREGVAMPQVLRPLSDLTQARLVVSKIAALSKKYALSDIAVLFRAGYQSYHVEMQLNKIGIPFKKYGGIRYSDAAHIKDVLSYARLVQNPLDLPAFQRMTALVRGIGAKTCLKIYEAFQQDDRNAAARACARFSDLQADLRLLDELRAKPISPLALVERIVEHYQPRLEANYPDDYPSRQHGLEQLLQIAATYNDVDMMLSDLCLDDAGLGAEEEKEETVTLSTIHSAKGLEWSAVLVIDLVEDRFPSRHALNKADDFEEERRLMYVACTRARDYLGLFVPVTVYEKNGGGNSPANPSPFVRDLPEHLFEDLRENYSGGLTLREFSTPRRVAQAEWANERRCAAEARAAGVDAGGAGSKLGASASAGGAGNRGAAPKSSGAAGAQGEWRGYCTHKIFGRGKIIQAIPPDKYRVNFQGFGLKVIMSQYLTLEK